MNLPVVIHFVRSRDAFVLRGRELQLESDEYRLLQLISALYNQHKSEIVTLSYDEVAPMFGTELDVETSYWLSHTLGTLTSEIKKIVGEKNLPENFQLMTWDKEKGQHVLSPLVQMRWISKPIAVWMEEPVPSHVNPKEADYVIWYADEPYSIGFNAYTLLKVLGSAPDGMPVKPGRIYEALAGGVNLSSQELIRQSGAIGKAAEELASLLLKAPVETNQILLLTPNGYMLSPAISVEFAGK